MVDIGKIKLIVGLGNIGAEYEKTRHNIGFMVIDKILSNLNCEINQEIGCKSSFFQVKYRGKPIILQKPSTYMNLSGDAVKLIMNKFKINRDEILIIHDELDLDLGTLKIKKGGSSGGHNGIKSIIENLDNSQDFLRLRVGISRDKNVIDYVLSDFKVDEHILLEKVIDEAVNAIYAVITMGYQKAMNKFNNTNLNSNNNV